MAKRVSIYLANEVLDGLFSPKSLSQRLNSILLRYFEICASHKPHLTEEEWYAVFDALRGCGSIALLNQDGIARCIWSVVRDTPDLGKKWGVDQHALAEKIRSMSYVEQCSIIEHATRFLQLDGIPREEALKKIGIVPE